jgi:predicted secreted protein
MSFQETAIGNMPAYRMDAEDTGNAVTMINIKSGDDLYSVTAVCRKGLFPLYRGLLEDMMTSLEIPAGKNKWVGVKELSKAEFSDPRAVIEVSRGKAVVITMRSNPTTGYSWVVAKPVDRKKLDPVEKGYIPAATGLVGAGGKDVFVFRAVGTGETTISLKYARAWEKEEKPADSAEFKVIIK